MKYVVIEAIKLTVLLVVIGFTSWGSLSMLNKYDNNLQSYAISVAKERGKASVTIEKPLEYEEVPFEVDKGDVVQIPNTTFKIKLPGTLTDDTMVSYGYYTYSSAKNSLSMTLAFEVRTSALDKIQKAMYSYWKDSPEELMSFYGMDYNQIDDYVFYQQSHRDGNIPIIHNVSTDIYYMFLRADNYFVIISANEPYIVTDEKVTVHYGDPSEDPMFHHNYNMYEVQAAENTRNELLSGVLEEGESVDNPFQSGDVVGTAETYTSEADNKIRKQMASYANYKWDENGQSSNTSLIIDFTSQEAKKSEWKLTSTTYSYERASLKVSSVSASRNSTEFVVNGNINNLLATERPYVIVSKFISNEGKLLDVKVLDNRKDPLGAEDVSTFGVTLRAEDIEYNLQHIAAIQFDMY